MKINVTYIDTACLVFEIGDFCFITDPALDERTGFLPKWVARPFIFSRKTMDSYRSAIPSNIDLALVSHDHHGDNLDSGGKELLEQVPLVLSTRGAERRLKNINVLGMKPWDTKHLCAESIPGLRVTAVPALHTNIPRLRYAVGEVIGFVIEWDEQKKGALYISGDTVLFEGIKQITDRFKIHTAVLHLGAGGFPYLNRHLRVTMNSQEAIEFAALANPSCIIPVHYEGWWHFREKPDKLKAILNNSSIHDKLIWLTRGNKLSIDI